jgi:hypothetical protein
LTETWERGLVSLVRQKIQKRKGGVKMGKIYAIDFDGILCKGMYPKIGKEIPENIEFVKQLMENEEQIILWTCREGDLLKKAVDWCTKRDLKFDAVNKNLSSTIEKYGNDCRKIYADYYIDDKNFSIEQYNSERKKLLKKIAVAMKK